jgi:hypothetical protein
MRRQKKTKLLVVVGCPGAQQANNRVDVVESSEKEDGETGETMEDETRQSSCNEKRYRTDLV